MIIIIVVERSYKIDQLLLLLLFLLVPIRVQILSFNSIQLANCFIAQLHAE